jgi:hypothetical protein
MPGKTPMWGNPMRERERFYYSVSGKYIIATITHFHPIEKPLTTPKNCPKLFASIFVPSLHCCTTHLEIMHLKIQENSLLYRLFCTA